MYLILQFDTVKIAKIWCTWNAGVVQ